MIQMQDVTFFDIPFEANSKEQRIVYQNEKPSGSSYTFAYNVKNPKSPNIVAPQTQTISPLINYLIQKLKTGTVKEQEKCLVVINKNLNTQGSEQFLDESLTNTLFELANADISNYKTASSAQKKLRRNFQEGKKLTQKEYQTAFSFSEKEAAECNQAEALFTIAKIQNVLYYELKKRSDLRPKFADMPAVPRLVNEAKNNKNERIKVAAVSAIGIMYKYSFYEDINTTLDNIAETTTSQKVKNQVSQVKEQLKTQHAMQIKKIEQNKMKTNIL